jgi:hypothetical protein
MLERKRLLRMKEQFMRDGRRILVYEHPKSGDVLTIIDPGLQLRQLDEVQHDVAALLEHGLNPPAVPPVEAAPMAPIAQADPQTAPAPAETTVT